MSKIYLVLALCLLQVNLQMTSFNQILKCAASVKAMTGSLVELVAGFNNTRQVMNVSISILEDVPKLLQECGKQDMEKLFNAYMSKQCLELVQLQFSYATTMQSLSEHPQSNQPLLHFYTKIIKAIKKAQYKHCEILNIDFSLIVDAASSQCLKSCRKKIEDIRIKEQGLIQSEYFSVGEYLLSFIAILNDPELTKSCGQQFKSYLSLDCFSSLSKMFKLYLYELALAKRERGKVRH